MIILIIKNYSLQWGALHAAAMEFFHTILFLLTAFKASTRHMQKNLFENDKWRMFHKLQMEFGLYSDQIWEDIQPPG